MIAIRALDPQADRAAVAALLAEAADYYHLWKDRAPGPDEVAGVFDDTPPGCDPALSHRPGLWLDGALSGVAELSFGFPAPGDAYLGLMILAPHARGHGHGAALLAHIERIARESGAHDIYLGVLEANPRGRAFWEAQGFRPTGVTRHDTTHARPHIVHRLVKTL